jgi:hypothetical protein
LAALPEPQAHEHTVREQLAREEAVETPATEAIAAETSTDAEGETGAPEEKPSRRRRGRRGRRTKKPEEAATSEGEGEDQAPVAVAAPEAGEKTDDEPVPRKRGRAPRPRGKPVKEAEPVDAVEPEEDDEAISAQPVDDSDDDDFDTHNPEEWDVPSWQELIASLYRPVKANWQKGDCPYRGHPYAREKEARPRDCPLFCNWR